MIAFVTLSWSLFIIIGLVLCVAWVDITLAYRRTKNKKDALIEVVGVVMVNVVLIGLLVLLFVGVMT